MNVPDNCRVYQFDRVTSTSDVAKLVKNSSEYSVVTAKEQTNGRGRNKNSWLSQRGNLHISIAFNGVRGFMGRYSILAAVAMGSILSSYDYTYKWPNDILIKGRKVAGVLIEVNGSNVVVGVGLNIENAPLESAACLNDYNVANVDEIAEKFLHSFIQHKDLSFALIKELWEEKAHLFGSEVTFNNNGEMINGRFLGIDSSCRLLLRTNSEKVRTLCSGSICI